jgi:hypothetical protein
VGADLRDLKDMERETWMEAVEEQRRYSFDKLIENEPVMIS